MRITQLKQLSSDRFLLTFDDAGELRVPLNLVADLSLYTGKELDGAEYAALINAAQLSGAKERAMRLINLRPMSEKELRDKLVEKGESPENAEECVRWLLDLHLLDDVQYAGMVVRHYAAKGYGPGRVKSELFRRGVPRALWDEALCELPDQEDTVYRLLCSRLRGAGTEDRAAVKKATDALFRRGYSWDEIRSALERYKSEMGE